MDRGGAWQAMVHTIAMSWTRLRQLSTHAPQLLSSRAESTEARMPKAYALQQQTPPQQEAQPLH